MLLIKFVLVAIGYGGLQMINRGDYRGLVFFLLAAVLWNWRPIMEWVQDRRWRNNWRTW